jgi:HEPN domain-containing protein
MRKPKKEAKRWFDQGRRDAASAAKVKEQGINEVCCFLAQQAAEKLLKAFLYAQGEAPVVGHSTFYLAKRCQEYDARFKKILQSCKRLDALYIPTRYPNGLVEGVPYEVFDANDAEQALHDLGTVRSLIEELLKDIES